MREMHHIRHHRENTGVLTTCVFKLMDKKLDWIMSAYSLKSKLLKNSDGTCCKRTCVPRVLHHFERDFGNQQMSWGENHCDARKGPM